MAYDEGLAERVRNILDEQHDLTEKQMFGGLCFLLGGKMCCGIVKDELMVRVGADQYAEALKQAYARPMDFTGRPLKGFVFVSPAGLDFEQQLEWWLTQGVACARSALLRPKARAKKPTRKKPTRKK